MKIKTRVTAVVLCALCFFSLIHIPVCAPADKPGDEKEERDRRDDKKRRRRRPRTRRDYPRRKYYRRYRYYPREYYYYRRLFYFPSRRYYDYYEIYPPKNYYNENEKKSAVDNPDHVSIINIANMASQGVPSAVIIFEIERTNSAYKLNAEIIEYLRLNGVSEEVIDFMQNAAKKK